METSCSCIYLLNRIITFALQKINMSQEERNESGSPYSNFRIALDIGMGVLYMALSGGVVYTKQFGTIELSAGVVYAMSGLLAFYGGFRIYRGIIELRNKKNSGG